MVLFKRKPVQFLPAAEIADEDTEVWHIPQTGEVFVSYEDYLTRMDFYKQRRFNDQITGHSGLTFFEAYTSEQTGGKEVEASFPEALKGPILRKVQFQTISRLDNLVDLIYDEFKQDYYPGEEVTITTDNGDRRHSLVRDKTAFGARFLADGTPSQPHTKYLVDMKESEGEIMVTEEHISRERGAFTKAMLRSFIKRTVIREAWNGAPWLVKHDYAAMYHIDTRIPPHLRYDTKLQERKQLQAQKRASLPHGEVNGNGTGSNAGPMRLPELKPAPKGKGKGQNGAGGKGLKWPLNMAVHGSNPAGSRQASYHDQRGLHPEPSPPPPPAPPKYPIEDLQLEPREGLTRPRLEFMCRNPPLKVDSMDPIYQEIDMNSVGPLLETWDTLNVYCEIFKLDSFTFDDFVEAMVVASEQTPVQLFDEIHCSVLKILVDSPQDGGKVRITLPEVEDEESDEEEVEEEEEEEQEGSPETEAKPFARATRSSLAKIEAERLAAEMEEEESRIELETTHRAEELLTDYDWIEQLRMREFTNGGWQRIMVGLLHQLSKSERQQEVCEDLLLQLVPPDVDPSPETVQQAYAEMDVNRRVKALQIICMLTTETKAIRGYMEDCSDTMTKYRKDKIEWQRQRRQATEELRQLQEQRKALMPENASTQASPAPDVKAEEDAEMIDAEEPQPVKDEDGEETEDDVNPARRKRRRQSDKQRKRELEQEKKEKEKAKKEAVKAPTQSKQLIKLLKDIQKKEEFLKKCEDEVSTIENDLREADCPRTRVLGKDRFWNRYYWFERNGMPYAGLPDSSTADAGYANGCIWVQGPDDLEREGYIDLPADLQKEYQAKFNMTVPERKAKEESPTSITTARQWGYIATPEQLDQLLEWLDPRGFNELKLRKELAGFKDRIAAHMIRRRDYLAGAEGRERERREREESKRSSSRIRDKTPEPPSYRCLQWENTMALEELGRLHSDPPPPPPRARKQTKKRGAEPEVLQPRKTRNR